jgi:biofilm PGA synthesis N-glycosyltransferase PgaC
VIRTADVVIAPDLSIVVPAFNEGANVEPVVREIVSAIAAQPWVGPYEIVLVNDGSRDETGAIMQRLAAELPQVRAFHHPANRGR